MSGAVSAELLFGEEAGKGYTYTVVARGYVTSDPLKGGYATMNTFHLTEKIAGATTKDIATNFKFMIGTAYDAVFYMSRPVFYTFEATYSNQVDAQKYYTELREEDGDGYIYYMNLSSSLAFGSLYFSDEESVDEGKVYPGGFFIDTSGYVFGPFGTFTFTDVDNYQQKTFLFDIHMVDGKAAYFTRVYEREQPVFRFNTTGDLDTQNIYLAMRDNELIYSQSGTMDNDLIRGTLEEIGETAFGEPICAFVANGVQQFKFVYTTYLYYEAGYGSQNILVYYVYNSALESKVPNLTLTGSEGTLKMDGFHLASLMGANGTQEGEYYTSFDNSVIYFSTGNRTSAYLVNGNSYTVLDAAYGRQSFYYKGDSYTVDFDGQGGFIVYLGTRRAGTGVYNILAVDPIECELFGTIDNSSVSLTVTFTWDGLSVRDENTSGVYISDDFAILRLDGYGSGRYYPADGSGGRTIYFDIASSEDGYLAARSEYFEYFNFIIDNETKTFRIPDYLGSEYTYYAEDFDALVLDTEGNAWLNGESGFYQVVGNTLKLYLQDPNTYSFHTTTISSLPSDGSSDGSSDDSRKYIVDGRTYYRWNGESVTFNGTLEVKNDEGDTTNSYDATLTFTPTGENMFYANATFTYTPSGQPSVSYSMQVVNRYYDYVAGVYRHLALYDSVSYEYSPFDTFTYNPTGESTFYSVIKEQVMRMYDGFEQVAEGAEPKNYLEETHVGFGPIHLSDVMLSGKLVLNNGQTLEFKNAPVFRIEYSDTIMGPMYTSIFEVGGKKYAVDYNKFDGDYWLYMVATYSELEAEENGTQYTVGLQKFLYSSGGYEFDSSLKVDDLHKIILFKGVGDAKETVVSFNGKVNGDNTAWLLELGDYDVTASSPSDDDLGTLHLFTFVEDLSSVTMEGYEFVQAPISNLTTSCYVNFAVDGDGKIVKPVAMLIWDTDSYQLLLYRSMNEVDGSPNAWAFHGVNGYVYTIRVLTNGDGSYQEDKNGKWVVELVSQTEETAQPTDQSQPNA